MSSERPRLSFVIPAHNEEARLPQSLERLEAYLRGLPYGVELIIVDDGSADRTHAIAAGFAGGLPANARLEVLRHEVNQGKGAAIRDGCLAASGQYVAFMDADLACPPEDSAKLLAAMEQGADVAIGSRIQPDGSDMRASQPPARRLAGWLFTFVRRLLVLRDIVDTQCPLKGFTRDAAQAIFSRQRLSGWAFDAEIIDLARRLGYRVEVVPVRWTHQEGSRLSLRPSQGFQVMRDLIRLRSLHRGETPVAETEREAGSTAQRLPP